MQSCVNLVLSTASRGRTCTSVSRDVCCDWCLLTYDHSNWHSRSRELCAFVSHQHPDGQVRLFSCLFLVYILMDARFTSTCYPTLGMAKTGACSLQIPHCPRTSLVLHTLRRYPEQACRPTRSPWSAGATGGALCSSGVFDSRDRKSVV